MKSKQTVYVCLTGILLVVVLLSLVLGSADFTLSELFGGITRQDGYETVSFILYSLRLPRTLAALIAGVGLSLSGTILQNTMGNPLVSPNTIGVNAGAGLTVVVFLTFFPKAIWALPLAAFVGAFGTSLLILAVSRKAVSRYTGGKGTVVLAGIAVTTLFQAIISFLSTLDTDVLSLYTAFSMGSLQGVTLEQILLPGILVLLCLVLSQFLSGRIAVLSLGDSMASSLGVSVRQMRTLCLLLASLSAASVVSYAGLLGFVGLVTPHMSRKLLGTNLRVQLTGSVLLGGILVTLSDLLGRVLFVPSEIAVGILLALVGAPFFFHLLLYKKETTNADL